MKKIFWSLILLLGMVLSVSSYASDQNVVILDVRTAEEFTESHVKGALNLDVLEDSFEENVSQLDRTKHYKVYCRSGNRSAKAVKIMQTLGFKEVENLGSLSDAAKKLNQSCEGKPCP